MQWDSTHFVDGSLVKKVINTRLDLNKNNKNW